MNKMDIKQIEVLKYHGWLIPNLTKDLKMNKQIRIGKRACIRLIRELNKEIFEELNVLKEKYAEVDDKGNKISIEKNGQKIYKYAQDKEPIIDKEFSDYLFQKHEIDVFPQDVKVFPNIVMFLELLDEVSELSSLEELQLGELIKVFKGEKKEEEAKQISDIKEVNENKEDKK